MWQQWVGNNNICLGMETSRCHCGKLHVLFFLYFQLENKHTEAFSRVFICSWALSVLGGVGDFDILLHLDIFASYSVCRFLSCQSHLLPYPKDVFIEFGSYDWRGHWSPLNCCSWAERTVGLWHGAIFCCIRKWFTYGHKGKRSPHIWVPLAGVAVFI